MDVKTIILCPVTLNYYYTTTAFNSPTDAFKHRREDFKFLGCPGWVATPENKKLYNDIFNEYGDIFPKYPGEYVNLP